VTRVQRLFGNDYTGMAEVDGCMTRGGSRRPAMYGPAAGTGLVLALLLLVAPIALGGVGAATDPSYAAVDTGGVDIQVPTALPHVDLTQDANASIGASLVLDRIVEVNASTDVPQIVARATVSDARSFNASGASGPNLLVGLSANLTVFLASGDLFPPAGAQNHLTPSIPIAPTTILVTVRTTATAGLVSVSATVTGWPWLSTTDVLAVGWSFEVGAATGFSGCTGVVPSTIPASDCGADPFASGNSTWDSGLDGIQGIASAGPQAQLGWGSTVSTSAGSVPTIAGAQRTTASAGSAEVVLGAPAKGADSVDYSLSYALALPPTVSDLLHGSLLPYLGGGAGAVLLAAGAVVYARRRDRQVLETL